MTKDTFTKLILENEEMMCKVAMSMLRNEKDCEDAMQSAILSAYEKLSTLKREEYFRTWLMRILINKCNKQLRQRKRTAELTEFQVASMFTLFMAFRRFVWVTSKVLAVLVGLLAHSVCFMSDRALLPQGRD